MTNPNYLPGWYPLAKTETLGAEPIMRQFAGQQVRLSRGAGGELGGCAASTGESLHMREAAGWIFAAHGNPLADEFADTQLISCPHTTARIEGYVGAGIADVAENILDTTHTSVVHHHYLRTPGSRRPVDATVESGTGWISATYPAGAAPNGWGARLLGAHRYTIRDRFSAPAVAQVLYTERDHPVFASNFALTPVSADETYVAATLAVPGRGLIAALKLAGLRLFFQRIFAEDRTILELIGANRALHGGAPLVFTPQDLLRPGIEAILSGRVPLAAQSRIALMV